MDLEKLLRFVDEFVHTKMGKRLKDIEFLIIRGSWQGQNYEEIAEAHGYTDKYLRQDVGPKLWKLLSETFGEKVSKTNFRAALERHYRSHTPDTKQSRSSPSNLSFQQLDPNSSNPEVALEESSSEVPTIANPDVSDVNLCQDWGEAVDVSAFYGRIEDLSILKQWIGKERCRLVALLGMGGIGKTALSVKLAEQIQDEFDYVIWRSLRNAPSIQSILSDLLKFLSNQQEVDLSETVSKSISQLVQYLRQSRCLLILDNFETILRSGEPVGSYLEDYEGYGELLRRVGEERHQSCLVLASREKPKEFALLEGDKLPIRSLQMQGLNFLEGQEIFHAKGSFSASEQEWKRLIEHYVGNPLALKVVASAIQEIFDGNFFEFLELLKQGTFVFDDIRDLLDRQFNRLSSIEKEVMYWLAIDRELVSLSDLQQDILTPATRQALPKALSALGRRSLIEKQSTGFTQQPVVMEYVTERLINEMYQEIISKKITCFNNYALLKAQAKDYIRKTQERLIVGPVVNKLLVSFEKKANLEDQLVQFLSDTRKAALFQAGYLGGNVLNLLCYLKSDLSGYDFSQLIIWQAYLQGVDLHHVNFAYSTLAKSVFTEICSTNLSVAFSPDGKLLAVGNADGNIRIWQVADGKKLITCKGHMSWSWRVVFSPDGKTLASSGMDQTVRVWDVDTGICLKILRGHSGWVWSVYFSPDGKTLASGCTDHTIKLWDVHTGECLKTLYGHTQGVWAVLFSPDGKTLVSGSDDHTIKLWDVHTGECLNTLQGHTNWIFSVALSPDGQTLVSGSADQTVRVWNVQTGNCLKTLSGHTKFIISVAFSPDGKTIASGSVDQTIRVWNVQMGNCLKTLSGHTGRIWSVTFSPDGKTIASGSEDQTVRLWDVHTGQSLRTVQGQSNSIRSIAFSLDGKAVASGSDDKTVRLWDVHTGQCVKTLHGHTNWLWSVGFSPDGTMLVSGCCDQTIRIWEVATGQCLRILRGHAHWVTSVAFSPNGQLLASGSTDKMLKIWNVSTGQCLQTLQGHINRIYGVSFSPCGQFLASASEDHTIKLWDVRTGKCLDTLRNHTNLVLSVAFSPDGQLLASGSADQTIMLWNVCTRKCLNTFTGHHNDIWSVAFSPNGQQLISSSDDQTIKLWDVQTGQCLNTLQGHVDGVWAVVYAPPTVQVNDQANQLFASGSQDGTIKIWDAAIAQCLKTLRSDRPYEHMNITGVTGLTDAQKETLKALGAVDLAPLPTEVITPIPYSPLSPNH